jgi:hypothetical protein
MDVGLVYCSLICGMNRMDIKVHNS